jgi:hypothetical protein
MDEKENVILRQLPQAKKVAVGGHGLATSLGRKALTKVSKFP